MFRCAACGAFNRVREPRPSGNPECGRCHRALDLSGAPQEVDGEGLDRAVLASPVPILLDLWAPWCAPCRAAAPILDAVGRAQAGRLLVLKLDTEQNPRSASALGVQGIPTFVVFQGGREVARRSGVMPKPELERWVAGATSAQGGAGVTA
ncbi:thioredoxin domain-containing protein [Myxococcus sp. K38C18041901]|uniref:thioredoxin family protein n=1 Tax=Myxococcus guangdongensis TaxID=2906760 RepID=UPI0020A6DC54|nr:thioredoxin domain-containing protein [Myxococcus guangdongensis]MCP3062798.1 thioredoxin domain-containing protein [Myxococcus guangdongensis]